MDRRLSPRYFRNEEDLLSTRNQTINGVDYQPGEVIDAGLDHGVRLKLWMSSRARYRSDYRPNRYAEDAPLVSETPEARLVESGSKGYYEIIAPWLDKPIKVRGKKAAEARYAKIVAEGPPEGWGAGPAETSDGEAGDTAGEGQESREPAEDPDAPVETEESSTDEDPAKTEG